MPKGGLGAGFCGLCGGSLLPTEGVACGGCRTDRPSTVKAKDRLVSEKQKAEFRALGDKIIVDFPF